MVDQSTMIDTSLSSDEIARSNHNTNLNLENDDQFIVDAKSLSKHIDPVLRHEEYFPISLRLPIDDNDISSISCMVIVVVAPGDVGCGGGDCAVTSIILASASN
jgi:hypothetical protein